MKNRTFLVNTLVLTINALILRGMGIYLTACINRTIGAEGVGLYSLIYTVYFMVSILVTSGFSQAITRLVAEEFEKRDGQAVRAVMIRSVLFSIIVSLFIAGLLYWGIDFISGTLLKDERAATPLLIIVPALPLMAVSSCLRGYFIAVRKAPKAASAALVEHIFRIYVTVRMLAAFAPRGLSWACSGVMLGAALSEVVTCLYICVLYYLERRTANPIRSEAPPGLTRRILSIALPMTASSGLRTGLRTAESLLIPIGLRQYGLENDAALKQFGVVTSMAMPVLLFPSSLLAAISTLIIPEIARSAAAGHNSRVRSMGSRVIQLTLLGSIFIGCVFFQFSGELALALFHNEAAGAVIKTLSPLVPFIYLDHVVDGMLVGLGQQMKNLQYNTMDSILRIAFILVLVPMWGLNGYLIAFMISTLFNAFLSIRHLLRVSGIRITTFNWIIKPLIGAALSCLAVSMLCRWAAPSLSQAGTLVIPAIIGAVILYVLFLPLTGSLDREDIRWLVAFIRAPAPALEK